jgi:hypothetical protein
MAGVRRVRLAVQVAQRVRAGWMLPVAAELTASAAAVGCGPTHSISLRELLLKLSTA